MVFVAAEHRRLALGERRVVQRLQQLRRRFARRLARIGPVPYRTPVIPEARCALAAGIHRAADGGQKVVYLGAVGNLTVDIDQAGILRLVDGRTLHLVELDTDADILPVLLDQFGGQIQANVRGAGEEHQGQDQGFAVQQPDIVAIALVEAKGIEHTIRLIRVVFDPRIVFAPARLVEGGVAADGRLPRRREPEEYEVVDLFAVDRQ